MPPRLSASASPRRLGAGLASLPRPVSFLIESTGCMLVFLTAVCIGWLCFMIVAPDKWSKWVDKENAFTLWVRKGIALAPPTEEKLKRFEKGVGMKILIGSGALLGFVVLLTIAFLLGRLALSGHR